MLKVGIFFVSSGENILNLSQMKRNVHVYMHRYRGELVFTEVVIAWKKLMCLARLHLLSNWDICLATCFHKGSNGNFVNSVSDQNYRNLADSSRPSCNDIIHKSKFWIYSEQSLLYIHPNEYVFKWMWYC